MGTQRDRPDEWRRGSDLSDFTLRPTTAQAYELNRNSCAAVSRVLPRPA